MGTCWNIRNGVSVKVFSYFWLMKDKTFKDLVLCFLTDSEANSTVKDWVVDGCFAVMPPMPRAGTDEKV